MRPNFFPTSGRRRVAPRAYLLVFPTFRPRRGARGREEILGAICGDRAWGNCEPEAFVTDLLHVGERSTAGRGIRWLLSTRRTGEWVSGACGTCRRVKMSICRGIGARGTGSSRVGGSICGPTGEEMHNVQKLPNIIWGCWDGGTVR